MDNRLTRGEWRCDVCQRGRPYDKISVAKHSSTNAEGVTVEHNVKYCNDNDMCGRHAQLRNHTDLAYRRAAHDRDVARARAEKLELYLSRYRILACTLAFILLYELIRM